jgi:predicted hydrocarbon binding protein
VHVGAERYVLMRAESFYLAWSEALEASFGAEATNELLYNTARAIGRADCASFCERLGVKDGVARLASGPLHFAHAGWAFVDIHDDSAPAPDDTYFLHYDHPNTFESEVLAKRGKTMATPACVFSAGYSAGWCTEAFQLEVHAREIQCTACGHGRCQFIMAPADKLDAHAARLTTKPA